MSARATLRSLVPRRNKRATQRVELERLRRELIEPRPLEDRDLLGLLAYAVAGDGDPIVGLLEEARSAVSLMSAKAEGDDESTLIGVERRLAAVIELYARATAKGVIDAT